MNIEYNSDIGHNLLPAFWWNNITGANQIIHQTVNALLNGKNVLLYIPMDLPWRHKMRNNVEADGGMSVYYLDIAEKEEKIKKNVI